MDLPFGMVLAFHHSADFGFYRLSVVKAVSYEKQIPIKFGSFGFDAGRHSVCGIAGADD